MGILNNLRKAFTSEWDDSKITCSRLNCSVKESGEGIGWMCQRCLEGYCGDHVSYVRFYVADLRGVTGYKVSEHAAGSTWSDMKEAEKMRDNMLFEQVEEWGNEFSRNEDPLKWGPIITRENENYERETGFILCKSCSNEIEGEKLHKEIKKLEGLKGIDFNWGHMAMDDVVRERLKKKYK